MDHKFTVILARPDWCADPFGQDHLLMYVTSLGEDVSLAVHNAKIEAWEIDNGGSYDPTGAPDDYHLVAVFKGWLRDLSPFVEE